MAGVLVAGVPKKSTGLKAVPFKLMIPRQLEPEQAKPIWEALEADDKVVLADPFALPGVSTVFPGVLYASAGTAVASGLKRVAKLVEPLQEAAPEDLADSWVELWVADSMTDAVEVEV